MIAYLKGKILSKQEESIVLEVNNIGYEVYLAERNLENVGEEAVLFCSLEANERGIKLYGFMTENQLDLFKIIRSIQGIGPRASLEISALGSLEEVKAIIEKGEAIPGIGPKKASKIILELTGKIKNQKQQFKKDEAYLALTSLGFSREQVLLALKSLPQEVTETKEKVKLALQFLGK